MLQLCQHWNVKSSVYSKPDTVTLNDCTQLVPRQFLQFLAQKLQGKIAGLWPWHLPKQASKEKDILFVAWRLKTADGELMNNAQECAGSQFFETFLVPEGHGLNKLCRNAKYGKTHILACVMLNLMHFMHLDITCKASSGGLQHKMRTCAVQEYPVCGANQEATHLQQTVKHMKAHVGINLANEASWDQGVSWISFPNIETLNVEPQASLVSPPLGYWLSNCHQLPINSYPGSMTQYIES